eukprot:gene27166-35891_t
MKHFYGSQQLSGHKGCVTCLETTGNGANIQLFSGAEDKSIRFWNLNENKSQKCITGCFDSCVTVLRASNINMHLLYAATEVSLYIFDIRFDGVLHRLPLHKFPQQFEDVNTLDTQCLPGNTDDIVAVGDDSGDIKLLKFDSFLYPQTLRGGYDCCCNIWDLSLGKVKSGINFGDISSIAARSSSTGSKEKLFNPPFVSSLRYLHNYNVIACGLGDGTIRLHSAQDLNKCYSSIDAHRGMITAMDNNDGFLASGEKINVLKVVASSNPAVATAVDDLESSQICSDGAKPKIEKASTDIGEGKKEKEEEEEDDGQDSPSTHCRLQGWEGLIVIAADVTNNITVYTPVEG